MEAVLTIFFLLAVYSKAESALSPDESLSVGTESTTIVANTTSTEPSRTAKTKPPTTTTTTLAPPSATELQIPLFFDVDDELHKIRKACFNGTHYEEIFGNTIKGYHLKEIGRDLMEAAAETIGLGELRKIMKFGPVRPWQKHVPCWKPNPKALAKTRSNEAYYNFKEKRSEVRSLDNEYVHEKALGPAITFLDKRLPGLRLIYRYKFAKKRYSNPRNIDRKMVDQMIEEFDSINRDIIEKIKNWRWSWCKNED